MLIVLTQQGTRCSNSPRKARKEFIQIRLKLGAPAMLGTTQQHPQIADRPMEPLQITIDRIIFHGSAVDTGRA